MIQYLYSSDSDQFITVANHLRTRSWIRCEKPEQHEIAELLTLGLDEI